jgi:aminoglycoside phosphotransferase (APT) family kinase protein
MHADEVHTDAHLVRRLLARQFPRWADLPLAPVASAGTDNALYRLGSNLVVRLPRIHWAVDDVHKEQRWLPILAPLLPVAIPTPVALGGPAEGYPWSWSVYEWLDGAPPVVGAIPDPAALAADLAHFVRTLQSIDPAGGPPAGRGIPLANRDDQTRAAVAALGDLIDGDAAAAVWKSALAAEPWTAPPVWLHADLAPGNLLLRNGRLGAVIDFGALGIGDPACDLIVAWNLLPAEVRAEFRRALSVDDATWQRGRGWALSIAAVAFAYYRQTNPPLADRSRFVIAELIADQG